MRGNFRRTTISPDEENPYWISFSDIMAGLLIIFILACLALIYQITDTRVKVDKELQELVAAEKVRDDILQEVKRELEQKGIKVHIERDTIIVPDALLGFRKASHQIPWSQRGNAITIGEIVYAAVARDQRTKYLDTIFVEGHTDPRPHTRDPLGNWGLSSDRAVQLWLFWQLNLGESQQLDELRNYADQFLFSVSGYGKNRPRNRVAGLEQEERYKRDRRIDIRITVKKPSRDDLNKIISALGGKIR